MIIWIVKENGFLNFPSMKALQSLFKWTMFQVSMNLNTWIPIANSWTLNPSWMSTYCDLFSYQTHMNLRTCAPHEMPNAKSGSIFLFLFALKIFASRLAMLSRKTTSTTSLWNSPIFVITNYKASPSNQCPWL